MKTNGYIIPLIGICIFTLFMCANVTAETQNKDLPTADQISTFVNSIKSPSVEILSETSKNDNPAWKWDTWKDKEGNKYISFYFTSTSARGYGSQYFDDSGKKVSLPCGGYELTYSYKGESNKDVSDTNSNKEVTEEKKTDVVSDEDKRADEVKKVKKLLTKYKNGNLSKDELKDKIDEILKEE